MRIETCPGCCTDSDALSWQELQASDEKGKGRQLPRVRHTLGTASTDSESARCTPGILLPLLFFSVCVSTLPRPTDRPSFYVFFFPAEIWHSGEVRPPAHAPSAPANAHSRTRAQVPIARRRTPPRALSPRVRRPLLNRGGKGKGSRREIATATVARRRAQARSPCRAAPRACQAHPPVANGIFAARRTCGIATTRQRTDAGRVARGGRHQAQWYFCACPLGLTVYRTAL
jgi:hypothetical protein